VPIRSLLLRGEGDLLLGERRDNQPHVADMGQRERLVVARVRRGRSCLSDPRLALESLEYPLDDPSPVHCELVVQLGAHARHLDRREPVGRQIEGHAGGRLPAASRL